MLVRKSIAFNKFVKFIIFSIGLKSTLHQTLYKIVYSNPTREDLPRWQSRKILSSSAHLSTPKSLVAEQSSVKKVSLSEKIFYN